MNIDFYFCIFDASLSFLVLALLLYVKYRVFRITKFNDKIILLLILFLVLEMVSNTCFYSYSIYQDWIFRCIPPEWMGKHLYIWYEKPIVTTMIICSHLFLITAILLNLRNWIYYYIRIGEMAYHSQYDNQHSSQIEDNEQGSHLAKLNKNSKYYITALNWGTLVIILTIDSFFMMSIVKLGIMTNDDENWIDNNKSE
jgi:hypothetical protein